MTISTDRGRVSKNLRIPFISSCFDSNSTISETRPGQRRDKEREKQKKGIKYTLYKVNNKIGIRLKISSQSPLRLLTSKRHKVIKIDDGK